MLPEFARFVSEIFPSITPAAAREYLNAIWKFGPVWSDIFATQLPPKLCQGDIVDSISFVVQDSDGEFGELTAPGIILSHSCDLDDDENILFAACRPFSHFQQHRSAGDIRNNTFFNTFYLEAVPVIGNQVVDFGIVQSVHRSVLERRLGKGDTRRVSSFTMVGYYFFIAKLTVRLLRPQPADEVRNLAAPPFGRRLLDAAREVVALGRYVVVGRQR